MKNKNIVEIKILCPSCRKTGIIKVDGQIIANSKRGVSAVNVSEDFICNHSFVVYVDRNLAIRDCFIYDFQIQIPKIALKGDKEVREVDFDVDIVKINLIPTLLINLLRSIFFGKKVVILFDEDFVGSNLLKFFQYITKDSFRLDLEIISHQYYKKTKKSYKDWIILESGNAIHDKEKVINLKQSKIESIFAQKFYSEFDTQSSLIIIKNELDKTYQLTESMIEFVKNYEDINELRTKEILKFFKKEYNVDLDLNYAKFLINVLEEYFGVKPRKAPESADFLGLF